MTSKEVVTIDGLCSILGINQSTARRWIQRGKLPKGFRYEVGGWYRWNRSEIEAIATEIKQ